jgi:hypothetical protein
MGGPEDVSAKALVIPIDDTAQHFIIPLYSLQRSAQASLFHGSW